MATKVIAWDTGSGNITLTYQGQGDGAISIQSDANEGNARSQVITVETVGGAITRGFTVSQAACPFPVGNVRNFSYTGSYQEIELPAGQYKLQCWGAQGGSNAAASSYGITAQAGGKGGYAEGIITLSQKTIVRVCVGGQGSSSAGGFNGGGSTTGSASYNSGNEQGVSRMGGGGGATDIRLSDGALLSRMIVAGGGAGGAMCYQKVTTTTTSWSSLSVSNHNQWVYGTTYVTEKRISGWSVGDYLRVKVTVSGASGIQVGCQNSSNVNIQNTSLTSGSYGYLTVPSNTAYITIQVFATGSYIAYSSISASAGKQVTTTSTTTDTNYQVGGVGGGTQGGAYSSTYAGKQNAAGSGGSFGQGAAQSVTNYRYCSGAGGGGWYGGGSSYSDSSMTNCKYSGGGSGFVNTAASAGNRPSGYTGLELDSGETKAGDTSFPNTAGTGNETGHSGNGYVKITRLS